MLPGNNLSMMVPKTNHGLGALVCASIVSHKAFGGIDITSNFPLYLEPDQPGNAQRRRLNFDTQLYALIRESAGLAESPTEPNAPLVCRHPTGEARPDGVKVFDYIYGVLHCPAYREMCGQFLEADFPRIPFPPSPQVFKRVSEHGETLRRLHLMEDAAIGATPYPFHGAGNNVVDKPRFVAGCVWINGRQCFDDVPNTAWEFRIGGCKPAQKWLTDRKGRSLTLDDVLHYQRIIKILTETDRIMHMIVLTNEGQGIPRVWHPLTPRHWRYARPR